eukprot:TRINITY_DN4103_c0_g1_i3.p1 TRINITY_DN4103_c0_g1~~TRINITY_DN4103_c0_g1_i3.p1  ORF type:complete len:173 (+),score=34.63 TRINITY_DN4103_c0_g1_i3:1111-1629(+)
MFFIKSGAQSYKPVGTERVLDPPPQQKEWAGEPVLWITWRHRGIFRAMQASDLILLDPTKFYDVMCLHPRPWFFAARYARDFVRFLGGLTKGLQDFLRDECFYAEAVSVADRETELNSRQSTVGTAESFRRFSTISQQTTSVTSRGLTGDEMDEVQTMFGKGGHGRRPVTDA